MIEHSLRISSPRTRDLRCESESTKEGSKKQDEGYIGQSADWYCWREVRSCEMASLLEEGEQAGSADCSSLASKGAHLLTAASR